MKRFLAILLTLVFVVAFTAVTSAEEPIVITIGKQFDVSGKTYPEGHAADGFNYYVDYVEQKTGVDIQYEWFLADDSQKTSMAVASGTMPDVMIVDQVTYNMLLESNMIADLTDAFENGISGTVLEEVAEAYPESFNAAKVGDQLMAVPNAVAQYENPVLWVRQDWLTKLELEMPKTLEDLEAVARAFVEQDPDGNGEDDTVGMCLMNTVFSDYNGSDSGDSIAAYFGAYPRMWYVDESGNAVYGSVAPGTKDALAWYADMYAEGLIDPEFAVDKASELIVSGKCGISYGRWAYAGNELKQSHAFDNADWTPCLCPLDENGLYNSRFRAPASTYVVVSKNCANIDKVIDIIVAEYEFHWYIGLDEEWTAKRTEYDAIGVQWGTMPIAIQLERTSIVEERAQAFVQYLSTGSVEGLSAQCQGFIDTYNEWVADSTSLGGWAWFKGMYQCGVLTTGENTSFVAPCFWGTTASMTDYWSSLRSMEEETFTRIVMGEADISEFDNFVEKWYAQGGDAITAEVQAYVDAH